MCHLDPFQVLSALIFRPVWLSFCEIWPRATHISQASTYEACTDEACRDEACIDRNRSENQNTRAEKWYFASSAFI